MDARKEVLASLDDVLGLKGRAAAFDDDTPLLGRLPELDSMSVAHLLTSLEERFDIVFDDEEIDASIFTDVGSLVDFVLRKVEQTVRE